MGAGILRRAGMIPSEEFLGRRIVRSRRKDPLHIHGLEVFRGTRLLVLPVTKVSIAAFPTTPVEES